MNGIQPRRQNFFRKVKMTEVGPGIVATGVTSACFIHRPSVLSILGLFDRYLS